jgi:hypothetical protein
MQSHQLFALGPDDRITLMNLKDLGLMTGKIAVGAVITLVPLLILAGGLWATQKLLAH